MEHDERLRMFHRISQTRNNETMRVAELIEQALYEATSDETKDALVALAHKVLRPWQVFTDPNDTGQVCGGCGEYPPTKGDSEGGGA